MQQRKKQRRCDTILVMFFVFGFANSLIINPLYAQIDSLPPLPPPAFSNLKIKKFTNFKADTLYLDSLTVLPNSLIIKDLQNKKIIDSTFFKLENHYLINLKKEFFKDLEIQYRTFPFDWTAPLAHKDSTWRGIDEGDRVSGYQYNPYQNNGNSTAGNGLNYNGSFSRGISFGNNQDLVLNSSFNLQLSGSLGDGIEILAAISDNNIPLQPEGNTQQLNEFDRLFIQIKKGKNALIAGDYELQRPDGYFMNYYKKLQGLTLATEVEVGGGNLQTAASAAISRGKFGRNTLPIQEGNQGPYKLVGNEGELFIIILAGTERVFIDGQLAQRGQTYDYVIDYNRGEITFTPRRLMTKDVRVQVEFEYTDLDYQRTLLAFKSSFQKEKLRLQFNAFGEQDGRNPTFQNELNPLQKAALVHISDATGTALVSSIDTARFSTDKILYKLVDTLVANVWYDSVLVYSTNRDSAQFEASFAEVGLGKGNYLLAQSAANGTVFRWVAPLAGKPQGTHEPLLRLTAPASQQLYTLGLDYQFSKNSTLKTEVAFSNRDLNRLSEVQNGDNVGAAARISYDNRLRLSRDSSKNTTTLHLSADYEVVQRTFKPLNPYRPREFVRDWNTNGLQPTEEHLFSGSATLQIKQWGSFQYQLSSFLKDSIYNGFRHFNLFKINQNGWDVRLESNYLTTQGLTVKSIFFRPKFNLSKKLFPSKNWRIGVYGEREKNEQYAAATQADSLLATSFFYDVVRFYLENTAETGLQLTLNAQQRTDYLPTEGSGDFVKITIADELNAQGQWLRNTTSQLRFNLSYRRLHITDSTRTNLQPQTTYLGRIDYQLAPKKGWLRANTTYEISSGQEQRVQFNYIKVEAGQGFYTWIDRNQDSIKQVDEFEIAVFQDQADHLRIATFTNDFIRTNTVTFNQSLALQPRSVWLREKGWKRVVAKFSTQSTWQINRKVRALPDVAAWNPFQANVSDSALVSVSSNVRNSIFFNQIDPKYGVEMGQFQTQNRLILTTGFERRQNEEWFIKFRWNISTRLNAQLYAALGEQINDSEAFNARDYALYFQAIEPQLTFFAAERAVRLEVSYQYKNTHNRLENAGETAQIHDGKLEFTYNRVSKSAYRLTFNYVRVAFDGLPNTPVEFAMLDGLKNGQNFIWSFTFDRSIAQNVQLRMSYDGRKTGENRIVHIGRATVRATF